MLRYATIGTSWITESFIDGANMVEGMKLITAFSRNEETGKQFAEKVGALNYSTDIEALAKSNEIDAVYIASPNSMHYEQSKLFLENGKHVICEKPITVTPKEHRELSELAEGRNLIYMEAIMMLHLPARMALREAISRIGRVNTAKFDFSQYSARYDLLQNGELPNIFNPKLATGCLMDLGVYCVYAALDLFGEPEDVIASAGFLSSGADGYGSAILKYSDKEVTLTYSKIGQSCIGSEIPGEKGTIVMPSVSKLTEMRLVMRDGEMQELSPDIEKDVLMSGEAQSFFNYVKKYNKYKNEYQYATNLAQSVSVTMEKIRKSAGIKFGV